MRVLILVLLLCSSVYCSAKINTINEEFEDSIPEYTYLDDAVVVSKNKIITATKTIIFADNKERESSQTITQLLRKLEIPQIIIAEDGSVTTTADEEVSIFINGIKSSKIDWSAVDMNNIIKIEYIDYPQDAKYFGAKHVIDVIIKEVDSGGFIKLYSSVDYHDKVGDNLVFSSRLSYKKMTFDFIFSQDFFENGHDGEDYTNHMDFTDNINIIQQNKLLSAYKQIQNYRGNLRAIYKSDLITISNLVGLTYDSKPHDMRVSLINLSPFQIDSSNFSSENTSSLSSFWIGDFQFLLPHNFSLSLNADFSFSSNKEHQSNYLLDNFLYDNNIKEKAFTGSASVGITKIFGKYGKLNISELFNESLYNIQYFGSSKGKQTSIPINSMLMLSYGINISDFMFQIYGAWSYRKYDTSGYVYVSNSPYIHFMGNWSHQNHSVSVNIAHGEMSYSGDMRNPQLSQTNLFIFSQGNPNLKNSPLTQIRASYNNQISNNFAFNIYANFDWEINKSVYSFIPKDNFIIMTTANNGNFYRHQIGINMNFLTINRNLKLNANPYLDFTSSTGLYNIRAFYLGIRANVYYYIKNFNIGIYYNSSQTVVTNTGTKTFIKDNYGLSIGWSNKEWSLSLYARNIFRNNWKTSLVYLDNPIFSSSSWFHSFSNHRRFEISLSYTLQYGKKVSSEIIEQKSHSTSAIHH